MWSPGQHNEVLCPIVPQVLTSQKVWVNVTPAAFFHSAPRAITQVMLQGPSSAAKSQGLLPNSPHWKENQSFEQGNLAVAVDPSERRSPFLCQSLQIFPRENRIGEQQVFFFFQ